MDWFESPPGTIDSKKGLEFQGLFYAWRNLGVMTSELAR